MVELTQVFVLSARVLVAASTLTYGVFEWHQTVMGGSWMPCVLASGHVHFSRAFPIIIIDWNFFWRDGVKVLQEFRLYEIDRYLLSKSAVPVDWLLTKERMPLLT